MTRAIGIDLGTTNSVAAAIQAGVPAVLRGADGHDIVPSAVAFRDGEIVVGHEAKALQADGDPHVVAFFKRSMGDPNFVVAGGGKTYTPIDLSSFVLLHLKKNAESALSEEVSEAAITVPAYFKNPEREATIQAGRQAGLTVLQAINEPTAAAIAYGARRTAENRKLLVYDLGGGTFDIAVLEQKGPEIAILSSTGDSELGGKDWDGWIVDRLSDCFALQHGLDPRTDEAWMAGATAIAENAKRRLGAVGSTKVSMSWGGKQGLYEITRQAFEAGTEPLMKRTEALCRLVLEDLGLKPADIDGVLLVGGSTRMPMVRTYIEREFGRAPLEGVNVDHVVALGAAMVAEELASAAKPSGRRLYLPPVKARDVTNHSLGMIAANPDNTAYLNARILSKNRPVPCEERRPFGLRTRAAGPNRLEIFLTQGESDAPADVTYLGLYAADGIPHVKGGMAIVDIAYAYDSSGTVRISGTLRETGQALTVRVEPLPADVPERFLRAPALERAASHVTCYLVFDLSYSMEGAPLAEAKKAALGFLAQMDLSQASVGVHGVADRNHTYLAACQDAGAIEKAIADLAVGGNNVGGANAGHPFDRLHDLLSGTEPPMLAIVLADGAWSDRPLAVRQAKRCHAAGIDIVAVGFGGADRAFLRDIASSDETSIFTSLEGLTHTFSTIAQAISESGGQLGLRSESAAGRSLKSRLSR